MQKLFNLTLILVIVSNYLFSQEIILTFASASDTISIDSIQAINLATNESLIVPGNESINLNDITTGTIEFKFSDNTLIYPNPFHDYATLQFETDRKDLIKLLMINSAGESVATFNQNLLPDNHQFKISAKSPGMYFINIQAGNKNISHKVINMTKGNADRIEYAGTNAESAGTNKSSKITQPEQVIHFRLYSGENVTIIADSPTESKTYEVDFYECKDADGQNYPIVQIGEQWWMAKNLAYLPRVSKVEENSSTQKHYYVTGYSGKDVNAAKASENYKTYGVLYNWIAAVDSTTNSSTIQGACPKGWHLPSDTDWEQLFQYINEQEGPYDKNYLNEKFWNGVGIHLKATNNWYWDNRHGNGTDNYGFSALPGGTHWINYFRDFQAMGAWWSSTSESESFHNAAWYRSIHTSTTTVFNSYQSKIFGFSIRCLKN